MLSTGSSPMWLRKLERYLGWIAIPNIAVLLVTMQVAGFLMILSSPVWAFRLALLPEAVRQGELWRMITFLALPLSTSPIWIIVALYFMYFIVNTIENEWGSFKTTLYVLTSVVVTVALSLALGFPVMQATDFESSLFLAAAALYPEMEIRLYFAIPVKLKWLGWLSLAYLGYRLVVTDLDGRIYLIAIYSNYLLFFGPAAWASLRQYYRRRAYRRKLK